MSILRGINSKKPGGLKKPHSNRERRFTFLLVYSHGKTLTYSYSLKTILALLAVVCMSLTTLGFFVSSYLDTKNENRELAYLYEVADLQEQKIREMQDYLANLADRLRQTELAESQTRNMLLQEGLIDQSLDEQSAIVASRQIALGVTSRSGVNRRTSIPVRSMSSILTSLDEYATGLNVQLSDLEERVDALHKDAVEAVDYSRAQPNIFPVNGSITSKYGWRKHPITRRSDFHEGIDIAGHYGTPIKATADGTVVFAGYKVGYGRTVVISHGYGLESLYSHCSSLKVSNWQKVRRGDIIGYVGSSGASTGPHLHYEIHKNGNSQNPLDFILPKK